MKKCLIKGSKLDIWKFFLKFEVFSLIFSFYKSEFSKHTFIKVGYGRIALPLTLCGAMITVKVHFCQMQRMLVHYFSTPLQK